MLVVSLGLNLLIKKYMRVLTSMMNAEGRAGSWAVLASGIGKLEGPEFLASIK